MTVPGIVAEVAYRGDQSIYLVKLANGRQMRVTQPNTLSAVTKDFFGDSARKGNKNDMGVDELR